METSPSLNSSIRSILIAAGAVGISKGWWSQTGLETLVDQLIALGGAVLVIGGTVWGIWSKRAASGEAQATAKKVIESGGPTT